MRRSALVVLLLASACSKPVPERSEPAPAMFDVSERAGPNVGVTAAPGVAFNYRYAFRLANSKIAAVQEEHATACEKLGISRCRITGMRYRLENEHDISAMLAFKLDPSIARAFGKEGIAAIDRAEGILVDSEITGDDAGAVISAAGKAAAGYREELAKIDEQLKRPKLSASERAELQARASELRDRLRSTAASRDDAQASLATTPMVFNYGSGDVIPGFGQDNPFREAVGAGWRSFSTMASFVLLFIAIVGPWALLGALGYWVWRWFRVRYPRAPRVEGE